jgi:hypothetical protein
MAMCAAKSLREMGRVIVYSAAVLLLALSLTVPGTSVSGQLQTSDPSVSSCPRSGQIASIRAIGTGTEQRLISVAGSPEAIGLQLGCLLREDIRAAVKAALSACAAAEGGRWRMCERRAAGLRSALTPAMSEELRGIANGAGVDETDLLVLNICSSTEFAPPGADQTTSLLAAWTPATLGGETYLGVTLNHVTGRIWIDRRPLYGRRTVILSNPGSLGGNMGLNEDLLGAVAISTQTADTNLVGLTAEVAMRVILETSALPDDALAVAMGLAYADGSQMLFGRGQAGVRGIESTARLHRELVPDMGTLATVGLYHDPDLSRTQTFVMSPESVTRLQRQWDMLEQTLQTNVGWIGVDKALATLQATISQGAHTLILFRPATQTLWVGDGGQQEVGNCLVFEPFGANGVKELP